MSEETGMYGESGQALEPSASASASGSKRKRTMEWAMKVPEADVRLLVESQSSPNQRQANHGREHDDDDGDHHDSHTPKRSRPSPSPKQQQQQQQQQPRSIRRKDARYGLSSLNRRQAEPADVHVSDNTRPSRFQEGSMSDKPSAQPPSLFTRDHSNHGLPALANVDHLMTQYHQENSTPAVYHTLRPTVNHPLQDESVDHRAASPFSAPTFDSIAPSTTPSVNKSAGGLFRFGKMFASTFNPANVWESFSRTWKESKEDLTVRNIQENRKRAQDDKAMYEQAYQELKKSGQFNFTLVPNKALTSPRLGGNSQFSSPRQPLTSPRHAAAYAHLRPDADFPYPRDTSLDSTVDAAAAAAPPQLAALFERDSNPATEPKSPQHLSPEKPLNKRKSFFTLRGASLRAPSLSSLRRGRSQANLSETVVRASEDFDQRTPSMSPEKPAPYNHLTLQSLPRTQSKKELNRAVKLNKRVSDLEAKLADARRELNNAITNASPLPPLPSRFEKFTPTSKSKFTRARFGLSGSKLPSLPSESLIQAESLARAQNTPSLVRPKPTHSQSFDLTHLRSPAQQRESVIVLDTPRSEIQSFLPVDYYNQAPMDPAALASPEAADQSEAENRPSLDDKLRAIDASIKSKPGAKKTPTKKRKSASKDDGTYKPPANDEEDELEYIKEKPKKKRKSTGKKAANVEPANKQPGPETGHGKMNKTNTKKQDSSKQHAIDQPIDLPLGRSSLDTLDPINEEDNIVVAPRVDSLNSLVPSQHDSAISTADAESIHGRTEPLKSILVNKYETARPTSRGSNKRPSSSQRRSSPPLDTIYTEPTLVTIQKEHIVTATPGVGSVPALPTTLDTATAGKPDAGAGSKQWEWPDDVF